VGINSDIGNIRLRIAGVNDCASSSIDEHLPEEIFLEPEIGELALFNEFHSQLT